MKYFGTDGIRGLAQSTFTPQFLRKIAYGIISFYKLNKLPKKLLVGNDSRLSSDYLLCGISAHLLQYGIEICNIGVCSSPCLAYVCKHEGCPLAMMISASHNDKEYNGIKFFNQYGEKLSESNEQIFETLMSKRPPKPTNFAHLYYKPKLKQSYIFYLKSLKANSIPIILDCANGGTTEIIKQVFPHQEKIFTSQNGDVNQNCGCTHLQNLIFLCKTKHKIGVAFDGDGDRVHFVSENGTILDGDKLLFLLSKYLCTPNDTIVGTLNTNSGLQNALKSNRINLKRANVGDKNVYALMQTLNSNLGGENSGHIIIKKFSNTGDGIITAIILLNYLQISNQKLDDLLTDYQQVYQLNHNLPLPPNFKLSTKIKEFITKAEKQNVRIVLRPSGTEPVIRIMIEHPSPELCKNYLQQLLELIKQN